MPKIFNFTRYALRDALVTAGPALLLVIGLCALAYWLVDPSPPRTVVLSTGQENSAYEEFGRQYASRLAAHGVKVTLKRSDGSQQNLQRLKDAAEDVDIAFVQSGSTGTAAAEGLVSLGSLFTEPVWLFYRESVALKQLKNSKTAAPELTRLAQFKGLRVNIGPEGSGAPQLFRNLLDVNGLQPADMVLSGLENTPATVELLEGRIDALMFSSAPDAPLIQMLLQTPGIRLFDFVQSQAYARRFPFLTHVSLPHGIVDLGRNIPARDYQLIAPTATLVAREGLHPALVDLFVQSAAQIHGGAGWFARQGEFPNPGYTEIAVAEDAKKYYKNGAPMLQRYMPFWLSNILDRMWVLIIAFGALLLPLSRVLPPLYVWRVRSRVFRWYGELRTVEQAIEGMPVEKRAVLCPQQLARLDEIEERVNQVSIPLAFAEELYVLRSHINFVRQRVQSLLPVLPDQAGNPSLDTPADAVRPGA